MGQVIQTNGDYNIKTREGGTILFDTGNRVGEVKVTGNLVVEGDTLTVSAEDLIVEDNIIVLNFGETGEGVSKRYAGIEIDRGQLPPALFLWDEDKTGVQKWVLATGSVGALSFQDSKLQLKQILTSSEDNGDLTLIGSAPGVVKVREDLSDNGDDYKNRVLSPNDIPNKKYVDDAIINQPSFQIVADVGENRTTTRVIVADADVPAGDPGSLQFFNQATGFSTAGGDSAISMVIDSQLTAQFYADKIFLQDLEINNNQITSSDTNGNVYVRTQGTGKLQTNFAIQLDKISGSPTFVPNASLLHSKTPGVGTTGVWFVNDSQDTASNNGSRYQRGELISKNKALVFSMIF